jgi:hypothetical protein
MYARMFDSKINQRGVDTNIKNVGHKAIKAGLLKALIDNRLNTHYAPHSNHWPKHLLSNSGNYNKNNAIMKTH